MSQQTTIIIVALIVVLVILILLLRGRKQKVSFGDQPAELPPMAPPAPKAPIATQKAAPVPVATPEGHGVGSEVSAAIEDVVDQFIGIDAHPSGQDQIKHAGDELTALKGLGPKAASKLHDLGVTTFAQIAAWDEGDIEAIDAQLGAFKGRIRRDRWVEQARFLAKGDTEGFEAAFGKLG